MFIKQVIAAGSLEDVYAPGKALNAAAPGSSPTLSTLVNPIIANILIISGIVAFFTIFLAGFNYVSAGGDKAKTEQAQNMLNYGIIGIIVIAAAFLITKLVGTQLSIKLL